MADQREKQRFSLVGFIAVLVLAAVTYFLVSERQLLILYSLATTLLVVILIAVAFDFGVGRTELKVVEEVPEEVEPPVIAPTPKLKKRKRRR